MNELIQSFVGKECAVACAGLYSYVGTIEEAKEKYDLYHISVKDRSSSYDWNNNRYNLDKAWSELLGEDHYFVATLDNLANTIVNIVKNHATETICGAGIQTTEDGNEVTW